ncbi:MAG: hypothetical protein A2293_11520 [Elusimicrobia bacterium RIFOXYB2_FULL_49_7]|nr:MAG: hypothetical protein A2293_11520 [Elusimicrobia bacterium RIFOXYB2_FULL_49_7]
MFNRFHSLILFVGIIAVTAMAGCGKKADSSSQPANPDAVPIRIAFWGAVEEKEIITKTVTDWEKKNPHVKIVLEHIPSGSYTDKVLTEIAGGNPPDIIFCEVNIFVTFFYKDALLDLAPFLAEDKNFDIKDFFPEVVARFSRDGKILCIPRDTAPFACIYYNKNLFDKFKLPYPKDDWDMNQFLATSKMLTFDENDKHPDEEGFNEKKIKNYGFWGWTWQNFVYSYGGRVVDDVNNPTKCLLSEQAAIDGVQMFVDLSYKHFVSPKPDSLTNMGMNINQLFTMEKLAMFQSGIWETPNLRKIIGNKFAWDVAMFPKGPGGKRGFGTGGSGYAILKTCKYPKEAWEVIKCLAGTTGQEMLADTGLAQPANRKIAEGKYWAASPKAPLNKKMLNQAVQYTLYDPFHPLWREASDKYIGQQMDLIIHNNIPVKAGLEKIASRINAILEKK